jgi:hypothetical protein
MNTTDSIANGMRTLWQWQGSNVQRGTVRGHTRLSASECVSVDLRTGRCIPCEAFADLAGLTGRRCSDRHYLLVATSLTQGGGPHEVGDGSSAGIRHPA